MNGESELRQDIVSGDWVLIAPGRAKRSNERFVNDGRRKIIPKTKCVFEHLGGSHGEPMLLQIGRGARWRVVVIENKYPALSHRGTCPVLAPDGPYRRLDGSGHQDLLITRSHTKNFSDLTPREAEEVFHAFIERYRALALDPCSMYVSIFQNWGRRAGASQDHPHYQMIAVPIIPPDIYHSLRGSKRYYEQHTKCVHCTIIAFEKKEQKRVVYENKDAMVIAPYASKKSFELRIFPKRHQAFFEDTHTFELRSIVAALQKALKALKRELHDPDYNFFIHTAPLRDKKQYGQYHWHIEVVPQTNVLAGFELGTGIVINSVDPNFVAQLLRRVV